MGVLNVTLDTSATVSLGASSQLLVLDTVPEATGFHPETGVSVGITTLSGMSVEYDGSNSYQPVAVDLNLAAGAGADTGDSAFLAPFMGNILGDTLTLPSNYLAGVIGAYSITGPLTATFGAAGLMGIIMDGVTEADACVIGVIDGSDPSSETRARSVFGVQVNNNNAASGVDYGIDLKSPINPGVTDSLQLAIANALIRGPDDFCILTGAGNPVDGTTGDDFAGKGSMYINLTDGGWWKQTGAIDSPTWVEMAEVP